MVAGPGGGWYAARVLGSLGRNNKNYIFKLSSAPHSQARLSSTQSSSPPAAHSATIARQCSWTDGVQRRDSIWLTSVGWGQSLTRFPLDLITLLVLLWCSVPSPAHTQPSPAQPSPAGREDNWGDSNRLPHFIIANCHPTSDLAANQQQTIAIDINLEFHFVLLII